jgi:hypothetical protein
MSPILARAQSQWSVGGAARSYSSSSARARRGSIIVENASGAYFATTTRTALATVCINTQIRRINCPEPPACVAGTYNRVDGKNGGGAKAYQQSLPGSFSKTTGTTLCSDCTAGKFLGTPPAPPPSPCAQTALRARTSLQMLTRATAAPS